MITRNILRAIGNDSTGSTAIEYGLIASLVVIACMGAIDSVADENTGMWAWVKADVSKAMDKK
ncbi:Flp family type IVb pilin [Altererythrobacter sp.]|uniref:Flp family type IVb pilin n=1 Tax=Altererythrobacter sp. TaxID=1872480 RepID=UPI003D045565